MSMSSREGLSGLFFTSGGSGDTTSVLPTFNLSQSTHKTHLETRLGVNLSKSGLKKWVNIGLGRFEKVTRCDLLGQVASSVGGVEDLVIEY